jgi:asparagine synthase (glutamine-hydrolysing)
MCGIAGAVGDIPFYVAGALAALRHRGPDGEGAVAEDAAEGLRLVHTRLAIQDLSSNAAQPMTSADGRFVLVFNGEIYNFHELRRDLKADGTRFRSRSDTEVLLEGWARHGPDFVHRCRGMFAFAVWDTRERTLWLVRDRLGVKPLYYTTRSGGLAFASEVRALVAGGGVPPQLAQDAIESFLAFGAVYDPLTTVEGVVSLPPGCLVRWKDGHVQQRTYWSLPEAGEAAKVDRKDAVAEVRALLDDAVALRLVSDVPVAVLLSSGIDSSAVAALAARARRVPLHSFTVRLEAEDGALDEADPARDFAHSLGLVHHEATLRAGDVVARLDDAWAAMDQPTIDGVNTYFVTEAVHREGIKVALSGLGGDEVFLGYPSVHSLGRALRMARAFGPLLKGLRPAADRLGPRLFGATPLAAAKLWELPFLEPSAGSVVELRRALFPRVGRRALLPGAAARRGAPHDPSAEPYLAWSRHEILGYMSNLLLRDTDASSMRHPVEVRVPLIDHVLVERVLRLPPSIRYVPGRQKGLLTDAVAAELPADLATRPKRGFVLPTARWLTTSLRERAEATLRDRARWESLGFDPDAVQAVWRRFLARPSQAVATRPWGLLALASYADSLAHAATATAHVPPTPTTRLVR